MGSFQQWSAFYDTDAWDELRRYTLRRYGCRCMCCGATDCELHVDHIKPRSKYPHLSLDAENLQVLCRECNYAKGSRIIDFRGRDVSINRQPSPLWPSFVTGIAILAVGLLVTAMIF